MAFSLLCINSYLELLSGVYEISIHGIEIMPTKFAKKRAAATINTIKIYLRINIPQLYLNLPACCRQVKGRYVYDKVTQLHSISQIILYVCRKNSKALTILTGA